MGTLGAGKKKAVKWGTGETGGNRENGEEITNMRFEISKRYARPEAMRAFGAGYRERPSAS